ncbi:hypothetical protein J2W58_003730 [Pseudomonas psychrotolerans]|nr:hypothetical protein [Pseudomonas psychrotolerans]
MGSYSFTTIGGYPIHSTKNYYERDWFRIKDRIIRTRKKSERNTLVWCAADPDEMDETETDYLYLVNCETLRRRLELCGYNSDTLKKDFDDYKIEWIEQLTQFNYPENYIKDVIDSTLDDWLQTLKKAVSLRYKYSTWDKDVNVGNDQLLRKFIDNKPIAIHETGFPCFGLENMAIAIMEILPSDAECILDVTALVEGGWTDSFDNFIEFSADHTAFCKTFYESLDDTVSLVELSPENKTLSRLLYANIITALETYLSDTLKKQVLSRLSIKRRFVQSNDAFKEKIFVQDIFRRLDSLNDEICITIDTMSFHNIDKAISVYKAVLDTDFPKTLIAPLKNAVEIRHNIVHRNGKTTLGEIVDVSSDDVVALAELARSTVTHIDKQIKDGLLDEEVDE